MWYFYPAEREVGLLGLQGDPPPQFPRVVGHLDLNIRETMRVVGLLTVMSFFQSKKFTACKMKDDKEETIFYFLIEFSLLKIIHPFERKKHLST